MPSAICTHLTHFFRLLWSKNCIQYCTRRLCFLPFSDVCFFSSSTVELLQVLTGLPTSYLLPYEFGPIICRFSYMHVLSIDGEQLNFSPRCLKGRQKEKRFWKQDIVRCGWKKDQRVRKTGKNIIIPSYIPPGIHHTSMIQCSVISVHAILKGGKKSFTQVATR